MKTAVKRTSALLLSLILIVSLLFVVIHRLTLPSSGSERFFSGAAEDYRQSLLTLGFPSDYAAALTELHMLHPEWTFLPLNVTELKSTYTWDYVIEQETKNPETNLISAASTYSAYHHPTNRQKYDSGYYQASAEAVSYFMDPRNFLNETDIFLFYDLSSTKNASLSAIETVLSGTFMQNTTLENGKTYAAYFQELGNTLGVDPVYLAVKARQEQGVGGTSPIISGTCGTKLWEFYRDQKQVSDAGNQILPPTEGYTEAELKALDGYYNFYNVKASGTGLFQIYCNAMQRAKLGTDSQKAAWGGNAAWNTKWKSLYGGAYLLKESYIDGYQSTVYLQKFNVDARSGRNFYGQYMQAVGGGLNEARSLYQSFASIDRLDGAYTFLIPVYKDMPQDPFADPAKGSCTQLAQASNRFSYQAELTKPARMSAASSPIYTEKQLYVGEQMEISGVLTHSYGIQELQYAWDLGQWHTLSNSNSFQFSVSADFSADSTHILLIRGKANYDPAIATRKQNAYVLYAVIYVNVVSPPTVTLTYQVGNTVETRAISAGTTVYLPTSPAESFAGWIGSDGSFLPSGASARITSDQTYTALFLDLKMLEGASISTTEPLPHLRFSAILDKRSYDALLTLSPSAFRMEAIITEHGNSAEQIKEPTQIKAVEAANTSFVKFDLDTDPLPEENYETQYSASMRIVLHYTNGESRAIKALHADTMRHAKAIALAALSDSTANYSAETLDFLKTVANAIE